MERSSSPAFIITLAGPEMKIYGAVYGECVYVDRLVPPVLLVQQPYCKKEMLQIAKTLKALKVSLTELSNYCTDQ